MKWVFERYDDVKGIERYIIPIYDSKYYEKLEGISCPHCKLRVDDIKDHLKNMHGFNELVKKDEEILPTLKGKHKEKTLCPSCQEFVGTEFYIQHREACEQKEEALKFAEKLLCTYPLIEALQQLKAEGWWGQLTNNTYLSIHHKSGASRFIGEATEELRYMFNLRLSKG